MALLETRTYATVEEMHAAYATRRAKIAKPQIIKEEAPPSTAPVGIGDKSVLTNAVFASDAKNAAALGTLPYRFRGVRVRRAVRLICAVNKAEPMDVLSGSRKQKLIPARRMICRFLKRKKFKNETIGKLIGRDRTTVLFHLGLVKRHR